MRFQRGILTLILILGVIVLFWQISVSQDSAKQVDVPVPSVTAIEDFFQVPWGISRTEALNLANASNLQPTPKGHFDYRGSSLIYNISFAGYPARIRFDFCERSKMDYSFFYRGSITLDRRTCPVEKIYWQLHKELTERYGQVPELGYPPRRNSGTDKPWGPGSGAIWAVESPDGQLFEIEATLDLSDTGSLQLVYHNISVERRFKNLINPLPEGDPVKATSDLKGLMDIPWGATPSQFRQGMEKNGFSSVEESNRPLSREAHTQFNKGTYADYPVDSVNAYFRYNAMYMVSVNIRGNENDGGNTVYNKLKALLQQRYGTPIEEKNFRNETVYIWQFPLEGFKPNHIMLHRYGSIVMVQYKNSALEDKLKNL